MAYMDHPGKPVSGLGNDKLKHDPTDSGCQRKLCVLIGIVKW